MAVDYFALGIIAYECMMGKVRLRTEHLLLLIEAIRGKDSQGYKRSHFVEVGLNKETRNPARMVC